MSFILDALKRSERARRVFGALQPAPTDHAATSTRSAWILGVAALLAINAALLAWFMLRPTGDPGTAAVAPTADGLVRSLAREAASAPDAPASLPAAAGAPEAAPSAVQLAELAPDQRARAAAYHVDIHGWADDPAERFVVINLRRRVVGDDLEGGATLVEIVADGAVIEIDGRRVLLPRQ